MKGFLNFRYTFFFPKRYRFLVNPTKVKKQTENRGAVTAL